jgi:SAM-dependent methyltransferase
LKSSDTAKFTGNLCGAECARPAEGLGREVRTCEACGSTVRLRALVALLSREIFGIAMALPDFPVMKSIRGIGMSDPPALAARLAEKFDYTNTFYHQAPSFDVTSFDPRDQGRYDFIVTSEVMEHVPVPLERSFETLFRMLKPDALLLMTTPYTLHGKTAEHFPELHEYALAAPGDRTVLLNRRRDGSLEVFENLVFHGGDGSTLEMRVFTEPSLRALLQSAGFGSV